MQPSSASSSDDDSIVSLILAARGGSSEALGTLLERYRDYLLVIAADDFDSTLRAKAGPSDLVQETLMEAQRDFSRFQGAQREDILRWLRGILRNNLVDFVRHYRTAARQVRREQPLAEAADGVSNPMGEPAADTDLPQMRLLLAEEELALRQAMEHLPPDYRRVVQLRHVEGLSWSEAAARMKRSIDAVQKLWVRALLRLREQLERE